MESFKAKFKRYKKYGNTNKWKIVFSFFEWIKIKKL